MVTYTPILKLAKPVFDQTPWDQDINGDLNILDSAIGNFFGIANYIGLWRNGTAYVAGQVVTDAVDSSMWTCVVSHTAAAGGTFAQDRTAHPTYWTKEIANATELAQDAANSAAAAAASAAAAAASAATVNNALPLAGGTMTGPLILSGDPAQGLGAATKQYVDARVGGTAFLPITGGVISGDLNVAGILSSANENYLGWLIRAYRPGTAPVIFGFNSTWGAGAGFHVDNVGNIIFNTYDGAAGGVFQRAYFTPAGGLWATQQVGAPYVYSTGAIGFANNVGFLNGDSANTFIQFETNGWKLLYQRSTGNLIFINSANAWLSWTDGGGVFHALGMHTNGQIYGGTVLGGYIQSGGNLDSYGRLTSYGPTTLNGYVSMNDGYSGGFTFGNVAVQNRIDVTNYIGCSGNATIAGQVACNSVAAGGPITAHDLGIAGAGSVAGNLTVGDLIANSDIRSHANIIAEGRGFQPGGGYWIALSDERIKTVNGPYVSSLAQLVQLDPVKYNYLDNHYVFDATYHPDTTVEHIGLIAQDTEEAMPELVKKVNGYINGQLVTDFRELDGSALIYAVINALKEVSTRLDALEAARR